MLKKIFRFNFFIIIIIIISVIGLSGCSSTPQEPPKKIDGDLIPPSPTENEVENSTPLDFSALENLSVASQKITESGIYRTETVGNVTALGKIYKQTVKTQKKVVNDECFVQSASYSSLKQTAEQQYFNKEKIYYRTGTDINKDCVVGKWSDEIEDYSKDKFYENYGIEPYGITKYYIHSDLIIASEVIKNEDDTYELKFELSPDAAVNMIREIKTQSGSAEYPTFNTIMISVLMDADWQIKTIITEEKYKINMFGLNLTCSTRFEENFYDIGNSDLQISEREYFI